MSLLKIVGVHTKFLFSKGQEKCTSLLNCCIKAPTLAKIEFEHCFSRGEKKQFRGVSKTCLVESLSAL